jgi:hypothetical protein
VRNAETSSAQWLLRGGTADCEALPPAATPYLRTSPWAPRSRPPSGPSFQATTLSRSITSGRSIRRSRSRPPCIGSGCVARPASSVGCASGPGGCRPSWSIRLGSSVEINKADGKIVVTKAGQRSAFDTEDRPPARCNSGRRDFARCPRTIAWSSSWGPTRRIFLQPWTRRLGRVSPSQGRSGQPRLEPVAL